MGSLNKISVLFLKFNVLLPDCKAIKLKVALVGLDVLGNLMDCCDTKNKVK